MSDPKAPKEETIAKVGAAPAADDAGRPAVPVVRYSMPAKLPQAQWEMVTPEMSHDALANMRRNRTLRNQRVEALKRDILLGRWKGFNGETVKQGEDGLWEDGQHRFTAIYRAGVAVPMLIVRGVTMDSRFTIDAGASKTYPDRLRMDNVLSAHTLGSIVRRMWYWDIRRQFMQSSRDVMPTDLELEDYRLKHDAELTRSLNVAAHAKDCWLTPTVLGTVAILLRRIDEDQANKFLQSMITGAELKVRDPAYVLRNRLKKESESEMRNYETRRALVFMAWNKFRDGEEIESLQLPRGREITNRNYPLPY